MKDTELCKNIQENLKSRNISLSDEDLCKLYVSTLSTISEQLNNGKEIEIRDLGSFWKKGEGKTSNSLFKPTEELIDLIKSKQ